VYTEQATNIKVRKLSPKDYISKVVDQIQNETYDISNLSTVDELYDNLLQNDIRARRELMASKVKSYYEGL
tara:strand:+ start:368 stop:580 length:213 start_codon:yes stop_codon:yes gene_type:complete